VDDGPRIGGLQALFLIVGGVSAFVTKVYVEAHAAGAVVAALFATGAFGLVAWLEVYAWRRRREDREEEERRRRAAAIAHLDFDDPFAPR
jgi:membrane protein implicated in regulation of membrane protease activity